MIRPVQLDLFAVIGNPVGHSLSPAMMNALFHSLNFPGLYAALEVEELAGALEILARVGFRGLSVTLPHKETAFRLAEEVDETAAVIGAVNTLRLENGRYVGRNTDWLGSNRALQSIISLHGKRAAVIGAGGVARAVVYGLIREHAEVTVFNRNARRGETLAKVFGCRFRPLQDVSAPFSEHYGFDLVVQCTSSGLSGKDAVSIVPESFFTKNMVVMDTVYRPVKTPCLQAAEKAGCRTINGLEMLVYQGAAQVEWWLDLKLPAAALTTMRTALLKALSNE